MRYSEEISASICLHSRQGISNITAANITNYCKSTIEINTGSINSSAFRDLFISANQFFNIPLTHFARRIILAFMLKVFLDIPMKYTD